MGNLLKNQATRDTDHHQVGHMRYRPSSSGPRKTWTIIKWTTWDMDHHQVGHVRHGPSSSGP